MYPLTILAFGLVFISTLVVCIPSVIALNATKASLLNITVSHNCVVFFPEEGNAF